MWERDIKDLPTVIPREIVSVVSGLYADLTNKNVYLKPRSSLPCSWFSVRECFIRAYESEYHDLSEELRDSYHSVYRELAFFLEDDFLKRFEKSYNVAASLYSDQEFKSSEQRPSERICRMLIALEHTCEGGVDRAKYWEKLQDIVPNCPAADRRRIFETVVYCAGTFKALDEEWVAFANLVAYQKKVEQA